MVGGQALDDRDDGNGADRRFSAEAYIRSDDVHAAHDSQHGSRAARELHREGKVLSMRGILRKICQWCDGALQQH